MADKVQLLTQASEFPAGFLGICSKSHSGSVEPIIISHHGHFSPKGILKSLEMQRARIKQGDDNFSNIGCPKDDKVISPSSFDFIDLPDAKFSCELAHHRPSIVSKADIKRDAQGLGFGEGSTQVPVAINKSREPKTPIPISHETVRGIGDSPLDGCFSVNVFETTFMETMNNSIWKPSCLGDFSKCASIKQHFLHLARNLMFSESGHIRPPYSYYTTLGEKGPI